MNETQLLLTPVPDHRGRFREVAIPRDLPQGRRAQQRLRTRARRANVLFDTLTRLQHLAADIAPACRWQGRLKTEASIATKWQARPPVRDHIGIRAITRSTEECYALLRRMNGEFRVVKQQHDDYIARPKPNGYRSIHLTVVAAGGFLVEVQLRTQRMHRQAESGAAAHRRYKPDPTPIYGATVSAMATHLASLGRPDFIGERLWKGAES